MRYSFEEIGSLCVTFPDGGCTKDAACKLDSGGNAVPCSAGDKVVGIVRMLRGGSAGVQIHGFAEVKYSGTAPTIGYVNLSANGNGGIKVDTAGKTHLIVAVNTADKTVTMEL